MPTPAFAVVAATHVVALGENDRRAFQIVVLILLSIPVENQVGAWLMAFVSAVP